MAFLGCRCESETSGFTGNTKRAVSMLSGVHGLLVHEPHRSGEGLGEKKAAIPPARVRRRRDPAGSLRYMALRYLRTASGPKTSTIPTAHARVWSISDVVDAVFGRNFAFGPRNKARTADAVIDTGW